ncbi:MAG TPA: shikimate dehydrogenase [Myxococcales bacterium]|nr:shikimate dehydrogenase [Myxococcales bacterium]
MPARYVVTLPPDRAGDEALAFAAAARRGGAQLLELRSDLTPDGAVDAAALARELPLLAAERGRRLPAAWREAAAEIDVPLGAPAEGATLRSWHAEAPLAPAEALAGWARLPPPGVPLKHVEPLGEPREGARLLETQRLLVERYGAGRVTVLPTGALALPFRALLAERNALDYVALDERFAAAPGQRLLADARRAEGGTGRPRRGILGTGLAQSRSPERHEAPFDRLDLPPDAPLDDLLSALHPFYAGFAVTSPFKKAAARLAGSPLPAVNTLCRTSSGWSGANTDVDGALAAIRGLGAAGLTALGDGGATAALRQVCVRERIELSVVRRDALPARPLAGTCVWTWPPELPPPASLRFAGARVAVITYGPRAERIASAIRERGGEPVGVGERWFTAQADGQARLWAEEA